MKKVKSPILLVLLAVIFTLSMAMPGVVLAQG